MIIENETEALFKIKRSAFKKNIHNLFIFSKSGICLYSRNFTNSYKIGRKQLISSFFTALMSFTRELLKNEVKTIEMVDVKLVVFEKNKFYYGFLTEATENIITSRLLAIVEKTSDFSASMIGIHTDDYLSMVLN